MTRDGQRFGSYADQAGIGVGPFSGSQIGWLVGKAWGKKVAKDRRKYTSESDYLDSQIRKRQKEVDKKKSRLQTARARQQRLSDEIAVLEQKHAGNQDVARDATKKIRDLDREIKKNRKQAQEIKDSIDYLEEALASSANNSRGEDIAKLTKKRAALTERRDALQADYAELLRINEGYESSKQRLGRLKGN